MTPDQVAAAVRQAVEAERERCARVAEEAFPVPDTGVVPRGSALAHSQRAAHHVADRIRAADPPAVPGEVERVVNVPFGGCYRTPCRRCGRNVELWYNGGELDSRECCGLSYALRCERVDLVVTDPARA